MAKKPIAPAPMVRDLEAEADEIVSQFIKEFGESTQRVVKFDLSALSDTSENQAVREMITVRLRDLGFQKSAGIAALLNGRWSFKNQNAGQNQVNIKSKAESKAKADQAYLDEMFERVVKQINAALESNPSPNGVTVKGCYSGPVIDRVDKYYKDAGWGGVSYSSGIWYMGGGEWGGSDNPETYVYPKSNETSLDTLRKQRKS